MQIDKFTVSRNDGTYECFPSLTRLRNGRLVLTYRESDSHVARDYSRVIVRVSDDDGKTWSDRKVLVATEKSDGVLTKYNCPKVQQMADGRVLVLCDAHPYPPGEASKDPAYSHIEFFWSRDNGDSWTGPEPIDVHGIMPDEVIELENGDWLLATQHGGVQYASRSTDQGKHWDPPVVVGKREGLKLCEASIVRMPGGELVCYMRENSRKGLPVYKSISADGGRTWQGPFETLMGAGHRPVAHLTRSGKVLITYRHYPGGAGPRAKNTFAYLEPVQSALKTDRSEQSGTVLPLDHDRSRKSDSGYTGWVEIAPGEFLAVNYIVDDAPRAQIRGYRFKETDF
jgi:sialidase-1